MGFPKDKMLLPVVVLLLLSMVTAAVQKDLTIYSAKEFYQLDGEKQRELLLGVELEDSNQVKALSRLLSDRTFDISGIYNGLCNFITRERADGMVNLVKDDKDLEMSLLGPACLTNSIIAARKEVPNMWPPCGFPLLVKDFKPRNILTKDIKDILAQALNQPEWWQSTAWIMHVKWNEMGDLRFWRMIPPRFADKDCHSYVIKTIFPINATPGHQDLEELFMKSIRLLHFVDDLRQKLKERGFEENVLLKKFSHLQDPWSTKVLNLLKRIYSSWWVRERLAGDLLTFGLLELSSWKDIPIDGATATNDIFELFTMALFLTLKEDGREAIRKALRSFINGIDVWSMVRPLVLAEAIEMVKRHARPGDYALFKKNAHNMLKNPHSRAVLPAELF